MSSNDRISLQRPGSPAPYYHEESKENEVDDQELLGIFARSFPSSDSSSSSSSLSGVSVAVISPSAASSASPAASVVIPREEETSVSGYEFPLFEEVVPPTEEIALLQHVMTARTMGELEKLLLGYFSGISPSSPLNLVADALVERIVGKIERRQFYQMSEAMSEMPPHLKRLILDVKNYIDQGKSREEIEKMMHEDRRYAAAGLTFSDIFPIVCPRVPESMEQIFIQECVQTMIAGFKKPHFPAKPLRPLPNEKNYASLFSHYKEREEPQYLRSYWDAPNRMAAEEVANDDWDAEVDQIAFFQEAEIEASLAVQDIVDRAWDVISKQS